MAKLSARKVGRCGELLVQYRLLRKGVDSSYLTTDPGIDLVAFPNVSQKPVTIQVKTSRHLGSAKETRLEWQIWENCPAEYIALVDFNRHKCWLIEIEVFKPKARSIPNNKRKLQWKFSDYAPERLKQKEEEFKEYEMETAISRVFGLE